MISSSYISIYLICSLSHNLSLFIESQVPLSYFCMILPLRWCWCLVVFVGGTLPRQDGYSVQHKQPGVQRQVHDPYPAQRACLSESLQATRSQVRGLVQGVSHEEHSSSAMHGVTTRTVLSVNCILFFNSFSFRMLSPASYKSLLFVFLWLMRLVLECNLICGVWRNFTWFEE